MAVPLMLGALFYALFRPLDRLVVGGLTEFGLEEPLISDKDYESGFSRLVLYNLPSSLWGYSGAYFFLSLGRSKKWLWAGTFLIVGTLLEVMQYTSWLGGTFDYLDLLMFYFGFLIAILRYD
ncbi:MAG: hypothetical protein AAFX87_15045 [Bacteroidota bacterium]